MIQKLKHVTVSARSVSYQKRAVLMKFEQVSEAVVRRCSSKVCKFYRKTPVLETLSNKVAILKPPLRETSTQVFSCKICKIFKTTFFTEQLQWLLLTFKREILDSAQKKKKISKFYDEMV